MTSRFVGIDLGAHNTVVASASDAEPFAISLDTNDLSNRATPTMIGFDAKQVLVGEAAESKASSRPKQIVPELLAALGSEAAARMQRFSCGFENGELGPFPFAEKDISIKASHALALYLEKLISFGQQSAEKAELCVAISDAMAESEVQMVFDALSLIGSPVKVLKHSTAMQLAYIHKERANLLESPKSVVLVNVGFGHSSATVATFSVEEGEVVSAGETEAAPVGISSFIDALVAHCSDVIEKKEKRKVEPGSKQALRLRTALQKSLKDLSMLPDTTLHLECFFPDDDIDVKIDLSRDILAGLIAKELSEIEALIPKVLEKAGKTWEDISSVEVVGGGSRVVAVQQALSSGLPEGMSLGSGLDSSSCVAVGSAYFVAAEKHRQVAAKGELPAPASSDLGVGELDTWIKGIHAAEEKRLRVENEFEAYIYKVQSWLSGPDKDLLQAAAPMVDGWQLWLEDAQAADTDFETYEAKFKEVQDFMTEKCSAYFEKVEKEREEKEKALDEAAEKERQRRKDLGMDNDKDDRSMPKAERLRLGESNKTEGNELFKAGKFDDAIRRYKKAVDHVTRPEVAQNLSPEEKEQADKIKSGCHLNMAQCYIKAASQVETDKGKNDAEPYYKKAKNSLDDCLEIGENVKARFRRANVWEKLGDIDKAMTDIKAALQVEPEDKDLLKSRDRFEKLLNKQKEAQKKMYGKMFG
mmetsp:Transcript_48774/g.115915  ORF Transcript_48774/g.115915 Transcript_48774/m.115915 type:complete len:700 (-) Transcript_48774:54-2153(-)